MTSTDLTGRGAGYNPENRFASASFEPLEIDLPADPDDPPPRLKTIFQADRSKSILAPNESPDIPFTYSVNPYRGCEHGCIYCYARPSHEYLGFSAGLDFESRIIVKPDAPELLRAAFRATNWKPEVICIAGNTDGYQPVERVLQLTRRCLQVFLEFQNPVSIITKNHLVTRDVDLLGALAERDLVSVALSVTSLDPEVARAMEPRASTPARRIDAVRTLAQAGVPVVVNIGPVVPGLTDEEIPAILEAARAAGARGAGYQLMRLPGAVEPLFVDWVERAFPLRAAKVLARIRDVREGELDEARFGVRMRGQGPVAAAIQQLFRIHCARLGLARKAPELSTARFFRPGEFQQELFS